jgi:hypothetical protein
MISLQKVARTREPAASLGRGHFPKEAGASARFSVYCSTEKAVYTLTVNAE